MLEVWKDVKDFEGVYQISNLGNVKKVYSNKSKLLKPFMSQGHFRVILFKNQSKIYKYVHKLVAESFLNFNNENYVVHHINLIKTDNRVENLKILTRSEHTTLHNDIERSKKNKQIEKIKKLYLKGYSGRQIAEKLDLSKSNVLLVIKKLGISRPRIKGGSTQNKNGKIKFIPSVEINEDELKEMYFNNMTFNEIKEKIGCGRVDLERKIKELGLKRDPITIRNEKGKFERRK